MPLENKLSIVGIGPGERRLRTAQAEDAIKRADFVVGYRPYLDLIADLLPGKKVVSSSMGKEVDRAKAAVDLMDEGSVALVSSGDPNIYGMAGLGLEMAGDSLDQVEIVPGVTSFTAAACKAGLIFRDCVAVISLSDLLTPWPEIEGRLRIAAEQGMPTALYNPKSRRRDWQLLKALTIFGEKTAVLMAKDVGRPGEELFWTTAGDLLEDEALRERIDMTTLVILDGRGAFRGEAFGEAGINIVGIGSGCRGQLTIEAESLLKGSAKIFGAERYLQLIGDVTSGEKVAHSGPCPERMAARFREASVVAEKGGRASILTGGDPSIFSSAWRILEARGTCKVHVSPGVSAFSAVAAKVGAPLVSDFALFSGPDNAQGAASMAGAGFAVAVYNARGHEIQLILQEIDPERPCALARDVGREGEEAMVLTAGDLLEARPSGFRFTLLIASSHSYIKDRRIIARRGYETKYSY
ncbi:MAG: SAM-dependent methyltransferase [Methanothrix sp.]|nr:SAM-dependent methyltransferase [Methanothrix sp.]